MEERLEAYRSKKREALETESRHERYWETFTFASLRRRIFGDRSGIVDPHTNTNVSATF